MPSSPRARSKATTRAAKVIRQLALPFLHSQVALLLLLSGCRTPSATTRVVDGEALEGRYVSPSAYASFMYAALLEAQGKLDLALAAYRRSLRYNAQSPEVWTRIGELGCAQNSNDHWHAFSRAQQLDEHYQPAWRGRARCHLKNGQALAALRASERAVALSPHDDESTTLALQALTALGRHSSAERWRRAQRLHRGELESVTPHASARSGEQRALKLDAALRQRDLTLARSAALAAELPPLEIALRALELGLPRLALEQSSLLLAANPSNANARVTALVAADWLRDERAFSSLLLAPREQQELAPKLVTLLRALVQRRTGFAVF